MPHKNLKKRTDYQKQYNHSEKGKRARRKYSQSDKGKKAHQKDTAKYHKTDKGRVTLSKYRQSNKGKQTFKRYIQSKKGKMADAKHQAKRKRNLGWIKMFDNPFEDSEIINWHHINDVYVVALPKDLHMIYSGNDHRENTMEVVKQIYEDKETKNKEK